MRVAAVVKIVACFGAGMVCLAESATSTGDRSTTWLCAGMVLWALSWVLDEMAGWRRM